MIEVIYKDEKQEAKGNEGIFSVPRNIRQIGMIGGNCRIYMEDYVYTFLCKISGEGKADAEEKSCLAVLTGEMKWAAGISYIFIRGAISVETGELSSEHIEFTDEAWRTIQEEEEKYFQGQEIAGWFFSEKSLPMEASELFRKVHQKHFGGEKVLMLMDPAEREEAFFRYENSFFIRESGYYLYYEKNPQMQAYMIEKNPELKEGMKEEVPDEAVKAFRRIVQKKKGTEETEETEERTSVFSYAATACLALAIIATGAKFYQNYHSVQRIDAKTETVSASAESGQKVGSTPAPSPTLSVLRPEESGFDKKTEEDSIYKQESDIRKAERRVREARKQESEEETETTEEQAAEGTEETESIKKTEEDKLETEELKKASATETVKDNTTSQAETSTIPDSGRSYIIRPGDTLYQISLENYGSMDAVEKICSMNGISADEIIYPGQIIVLP